jgi:cyclopropane fatty-acyl-phospholipid synthase-like methyltransferase
VNYWDDQVTDLAAAKFAVWSEDPSTYESRTAECVDVLERLCTFADGNDVMEIGCGIGRLTGTLAKRHPQANFIGIDSSQPMVEMAKEIHGGWSKVGYPNLGFIHGDGKRLPLSHLTWDTIYSMVTFQHIEPHTLQWYLHQVGRMLRMDGTLAFQFVLGEEKGENSFQYSMLEMGDMLGEALLQITSIETGTMYPEWCWMTAVRAR